MTEYLQDKLRNMTYEELSALLPFPVEQFKTKPYRHQLASFLALLSMDGFFGALEMGLGKSKVVVDVCDYLRACGLITKSVLVVAFSPSLENFGRQIEMHSNSTFTILRGTYEERLAKSKQDTNYHIINYEGLLVMCCAFVFNRKTGKNERKLNQKMLSSFASRYDVVVFDDSHLVKNPRATTTKVAMKLAECGRYRYCMTGTPFGSDLMDIFSQMYLVDRGKSFGNGWYFFRSNHFRPYGPFEWRLKKGAEEKILDVYHRHSIRFEEHECYDVPEIVRTKSVFELSDEQRNLYDRLVDKEDVDDLTAPGNRWIKFRQIVSGGMYQTRLVDEELEHSLRQFDPNPKLDLFVELVKQAITWTKVLVFHDFIFEAEMIEEALSSITKFASMRGDIKDCDAEWKRFQNRPSVEVMVAHPKSGGAAFDFVNCAVCIFFSSPLDIITRKQCEKRIVRQTQKSKRVFYYDLVAEKTIEGSILATLEKGRDFHTRALTRPEFDRAVMGGGLG